MTQNESSPDQLLIQAIMDGLVDERGIHAETAIAAAASLAGEFALRMAAHPLQAIPAGKIVYSQAVNEILFGDVESGWPVHTTFGIFHHAMESFGLDPGLMPPVAELAATAAAHAYQGAWPWLTVPEDNFPHVEPARLAARFRPTLLALGQKLRKDPPWLMMWPTVGCVRLLAMTQGALASNIGVRLALEVMIGTAKMRPLDSPDQVIDAAAFKGQIEAFVSR